MTSTRQILTCRLALQTPSFPDTSPQSPYPYLPLTSTAASTPRHFFRILQGSSHESHRPRSHESQPGLSR